METKPPDEFSVTVESWIKWHFWNLEKVVFIFFCMWIFGPGWTPKMIHLCNKNATMKTHSHRVKTKVNCPRTKTYKIKWWFPTSSRFRCDSRSVITHKPLGLYSKSNGGENANVDMIVFQIFPFFFFFFFWVHLANEFVVWGRPCTVSGINWRKVLAGGIFFGTVFGRCRISNVNDRATANATTYMIYHPIHNFIFGVIFSRFTISNNDEFKRRADCVGFL